MIQTYMGRDFLSISSLGFPFQIIKNNLFVLCADSHRIQRSVSPKILFFLEGKCRITLKDSLNEVVQAGDILIMPVSCRHLYASISKEQDVRIYTFGLFFPPEILKSKRWVGVEKELLPVLQSLLSKPCVIPGGFDFELRHLVSEFRQEWENQCIGYPLQLRMLAMTILIQLARKLNHTTRRDIHHLRTPTHLIDEAKEFMSRAMTSPLTLGHIAWHVKLSEEHLARIFKKETGMTVMDYLRYLRVDAAKTLLLSSNDTIETLSKRLGFGSVNPFCRIFKEYTGQTPSQYRLNHTGIREEKTIPLRSVATTRAKPPHGFSRKHRQKS